MKLRYFLLCAFYVLDIAILPAQVQVVVNGLDTPTALAISGNELFIAEADAGRIVKIDINESNPIPETVYMGLGSPDGFALDENELYIAEPNESRISKIDITDDFPTLIEVITGLDAPVKLLINENDLYISEYWADKLSKIDITENPPTLIDVVNDIGGPSCMALHGNELYISNYDVGKISKIDINDPNPITEDVVTGLSSPTGLVFYGDDLFIAEFGANQIIKININDNPPIPEIAVQIWEPYVLLPNGNDLFVTQPVSGTVSRIDMTMVGINESKSKIFSICPNPAVDFIRITNLPTNKYYRVFNANGVVVLRGQVTINGSVDIRILAKGVYFIQFDGSKSMKFVKRQ